MPGFIIKNAFPTIFAAGQFTENRNKYFFPNGHHKLKNSILKANFPYF